jgi:MFS family permease
MSANVVFFVGSLVAALANSIGMLIAARAVQGIGGGGLITLVSVSIGDLFSMRVRGMYYGLVGFVWASKSPLHP